MNWTEAQAEAISYEKNKNILVAAAAGSGKTAVLVERIIRKILDPENPVSVDEILVLTFTNAAAKEMKGKIAAAIRKKLEEFPDNKRLARQAAAVQSTDISTIHAFAQKIITNNIHRTDIPVGFTLSSETENQMLTDRVIAEVLERYYARIDKLPSFSHLTLGHGGVKNDNNLRQTIGEIYKFSRSLAMPERWLNDSVDKYRAVYKSGSISGTVWEQYFLEAAGDPVRQIRECYAEINKIIDQSLPEDHKYCGFFAIEGEMFKALAGADNIDDFFRLKDKIEFKTKPRRTKEDKGDPILSSALDRIDALRDRAKGIFKKNRLFAYQSPSEAAEHIALLYPEMRTLKNIVLTVGRRHTRLKLADSMLDFNDLEHRLLALIMNRDGSPTEFCRQLGEKYKAIFVDEYQDTNNIQDTLFKLISGGRGNIFMVGDIKQSIYKFRNASPDLFLEKYNSYAAGEAGHLSILSDNFRSRQTVVDSVNFLFRKIMFKSGAEIDYTDDESLHCKADYPATGNDEAYATELIMTDISQEDVADKTVLEATTVAERILDLVLEERLPVYDRDTDSTRPADFGDIAVLMRATKADAPVFAQVFRDYGIPVSTDSGGGLLSSLEARTVLSFLEIIDNPVQDIPLLAVMRSPIFGFTPDELAEIRSGRRQGGFYHAARHAAEKGNQKAKTFFETLDKMRKFSKYMGIHELIYKICYDLNYMAIARGMKGGEVRKANLNLLLRIAADYEKTRLSGLFNFVDYITHADGGSIQQASGAGGGSVSITTVHKSKGLEYPIVILAGTVKGRANDGQTLYDQEIGLAMEYVDTDSRIKYPALPVDIIRHKKRKEARAEEMRLLYVAMTRAREKLIISATNGTAGQSKAWLRPVVDSGGKVMRLCIEQTECFRDWVVFGFLDNKHAEPLRELMEADISDLEIDESSCPFRFVLSTAAEEPPKAAPEEAEQEIQEEAAPAKYEDEELRQRLGYVYPHAALTRIPIKLSVSEIKRSSQSDQDGEYIPALSRISRRNFREGEVNPAAEVGTITHFVMQHIDPVRTQNIDRVLDQAEELVAKGMLTKAQAEAVDYYSITRFFASEIGERVCRAFEEGRLKRELKMLFPVKAGEVYSQIPKDAPEYNAEIIVQGIADCVIFDDDGLTLIDYKTDNCTDHRILLRAESYGEQIALYKEGLELIYGKPVKESYIYFMKPGACVNMTELNREF